MLYSGYLSSVKSRQYISKLKIYKKAVIVK